MAPTVSSIGTCRVDPSRPVDVDMVSAQALQAVGQEVLDRRRPAVEAETSRRRGRAGRRTSR